MAGGLKGRSRDTHNNRLRSKGRDETNGDVYRCDGDRSYNTLHQCNNNTLINQTQNQRCNINLRALRT